MNILLVDDDTNIRTIAVIGLEDMPEWNVTEASSGMEALSTMEKQSFDLVLLDMMMPGIDGITVFNKIKEQAKYAQLPIIFMTAKVQEHEVAGYKKLGASGVIIKPFYPLTLADDIKAILGG